MIVRTNAKHPNRVKLKDFLLEWKLPEEKPDPQDELAKHERMQANLMACFGMKKGKKDG